MNWGSRSSNYMNKKKDNKSPRNVKRIFSLQNQKWEVLEVKLDYAECSTPCAFAL